MVGVGVIAKFCWDWHGGHAGHCFDSCGVRQHSVAGSGLCVGHGVFCIIRGVVGAGWDIVAESGLRYARFFVMWGFVAEDCDRFEHGVQSVSSLCDGRGVGCVAVIVWQVNSGC